MMQKKTTDQKKNKKDPFEEILEILESYEEGNVPRTGKDYEM